MSSAPAFGQLFAGRFVIEHAAGRGGMGAVYRAKDTHTGQLVALKLLHIAPVIDEAAQRFAREAALLAELCHPGIVAYVAHGIADGDQPYLAMEWLDGEDLRQRLLQRGLTLLECLTLIHKVALALSLAHERGIVHRDLKPSNLFLRGGRVDDVALLDFGVARHAAPSQVMTRTGMIIGTPDYMAPEQANGQHDITPSADVFALGCVLYECLTGTPPFAAPHFAAVLAKILLAEPAKIKDMRPAVPSALSTLVERMLAKDPAQRLPDASALVSALSALDGVPDLDAPAPVETQPSAGLAFAAQQLVSVVLSSSSSVPFDHAMLDTLRAALSPYGAEVEELVDGSVVATLVPRRGAATDQAALAVRCALIIKERWPEAMVALATGRGVVSDRVLPAGEAMDRAGQLLQDHGQARSTTRGQIVLDEVTAGLVGARFQVSQTGERAFVLEGEPLSADESRPLLGKPTPCVGREYELTALELALRTCEEEASACAVLVTAPAGVGKSRLRHEFVRRVAKRDEEVLVLIGRGDPMTAGSSHGLLGQAVRGLCGVLDGEDAEVRRDKLRRRVAERLAPEEAAQIAPFIGELCGVPFSDDSSVRLRAARADPKLMSVQTSQALVAFFKAECEVRPVLLVLEDLHWCDALTVKLVDEMLRALGQHPCMVLALARLEVKERFPCLWPSFLQEIPLRALSRKASEQLAKQVLASAATESVVARIVEQAAGNALYLEELIRAAAEGKADTLPETVAAMLQVRILRLPAGARQTLLAASVFGQTFWAGGVKALSPGAETRDGLDRRLESLTELEIIERLHHSRFPSETEYRFRHALVRDAAYSLLPETQKPLGHQLAGAYLEGIGEPDPLVLAEHFEKGGDSERAGYCYLRAAERALSGGDATATMAHARRGLTGPVPEALRIKLLGILCEAVVWHLELLADVLPDAEELIRSTERGSMPWVQGMCAKLNGVMQAGRLAEFMETLGALRQVDPTEDTGGPLSFALATGMYLLDLTGQIVASTGFGERLAMVAHATEDRAPLASIMWHIVCGGRNGYATKDPWSAFEHCNSAVAIARANGHERYLGIAQVFLSMNLWCLGAPVEAERTLSNITLPDEETSYLSSVRPFCLAWLLAERGAFEAARAWASRLAASGQARSLPLEEGLGRWVLAEVLRRMGELDAAEREIQAALARIFPRDHAGAMATLAALRLSQGRPAEALAAAQEGMTKAEAAGASSFFFRDAFLYLTHAECLEATHDHAAARAAIATARSWILGIAGKIGDPAYRTSFLEGVPENKKTLELAREWLGAPGESSPGDV